MYNLINFKWNFCIQQNCFYMLIKVTKTSIERCKLCYSVVFLIRILLSITLIGVYRISDFFACHKICENLTETFLICVSHFCEFKSFFFLWKMVQNINSVYSNICDLKEIAGKSENWIIAKIIGYAVCLIHTNLFSEGWLVDVLAVDPFRTLLNVSRRVTLNSCAVVDIVLASVIFQGTVIGIGVWNIQIY